MVRIVVYIKKIILIGWKLIMKTLGFTKVLLLPLMISGTIMGSSIASPIPPLRSPTSEGSISTRRENPEEEREESQASQTGNDITEALTTLNKILEALVEVLSEEKSSPPHNPRKSKPMKRQNNCFFTMC